VRERNLVSVPDGDVEVVPTPAFLASLVGESHVFSYGADLVRCKFNP
jgi:hypothetical protein